MRHVHEYLATSPFDVYELHLFHLVAKHGSFTRAAELAGLTQSAVSRQIQGMEASLGLALLERTTRSVRLTPAGDFLYQESVRLLGDVDATLLRLREEFGGARKSVRVGVSHSIGLAYLPGFFHANLRRLPELSIQVSSQAGETILAALQANELDLGVVAGGHRLPASLVVTHRFEDMFCLIASIAQTPEKGTRLTAKALQKWADGQKWMLLGEADATGRQLRHWMKQQGWKVEPAMELDNFDLIINLVSLGMGASIVPVRALALYGQKKSIRRVPLPAKFSRELQVVTRRQRKMPPHLAEFIKNILF